MERELPVLFWICRIFSERASEEMAGITVLREWVEGASSRIAAIFLMALSWYIFLSAALIRSSIIK